MFEFAIYAGVILIGCMTATHYYFADKIKHNINKARERWCKETAKSAVEGFRRLIETYGSQATPPYNKVEEFYTDLYKKEFETVDILLAAERPLRWLDDSLKCLTSAIILFLATGIFPYISLSEYSLATLLTGIAMVIIATFQIYRITRVI